MRKRILGISCLGTRILEPHTKMSAKRKREIAAAVRAAKLVPFVATDFFERREIPFLLRFAVAERDLFYAKLAWRVLWK